MKIAQILNTRHITHLLIGFLLVATLGACSDEGDRDKDVFGFEGNKDEILSIEVTNTQNESLRQIKLKVSLKAKHNVPLYSFLFLKIVLSAKMNCSIF